MNKKPRVLVLKTDGTNRDEETAFVFQVAGADTKIVHVNELRDKSERLKNYHILALPGGFSYGDDVASGKILAIELISFFAEELKKFVQRKDTLVIGICNGFQALVRTGVLPFETIGEMQTTLTNNDSGRFECRWIQAVVDNKTKCIFLQNLKNNRMWFPIAHGEGKFFAPKKTLQKVEKNNLVAFRYVDKNGKQTQEYPFNPNGSLNAIMGICDTTGRVLGLMPHPECFIRIEQHPNWRRLQNLTPHGLPIFENMISFIKNA